jgi:hypothetical protein
MALIRVQTAELNQKGNLITLTDITGQDNIADSTKYATGSTNLNRSKNNNISEVVITTPDKLVYTLVDNEAISTPVIEIIAKGTVFPKASLTKTISPTDIGLASTALFPDGVYKIEIYQHYILDTIEESTGVFLSNLSLSLLGYINTIKLGYVDTSLGKFILNNDTGTPVLLSSYTQFNNNILSVVSEIMLCDKPLFTNTIYGYTCFATYKTTLYIKNTTNLLKCFQPKIAKISIEEKSCCSSCKENSQKSLEDIFYGLFIIDAQFADGLYEEANKGILTLNKICNNEGCGC